MKLRVRVALGRNVTEGTRLLWAELARRGWSQEDLRRSVHVARGVVGRWLYGDRLPDLASATKLQRLLGIPIEAWSAGPTEPFSLPQDDVYPGAA